MNPFRQSHSTILLQGAFGLSTKQGLLHGSDVQAVWSRRCFRWRWRWRRLGPGGCEGRKVATTGHIID